jgi:HEAT repeat protein
MSLEVGTAGPLVDRAISTCLSDGGAQPLVAILEQAPAESGVAGRRLLARLTQPTAIGAIASREPLDESSLDYLMPSLTIEGYGTLLDVLAASRSRVTRRKLLERLAATPLDVAPLLASRLEDDRWYVQRNMLLLLARVGRVPDGFPLARWTAHADPRLRAEALRLQMSLPGQLELGLRAAFSDADPRVVRAGIAVVQQGCPPRVLPFLSGLARGERVPEDLRVLAVQALGNTQDRAALDALIGLVDGGRNFLGRQKLAAKNPVVLAALRALAGGWRTHPHVEPLIGLAAASTDDDVRGAVR